MKYYFYDNKGYVTLIYHIPPSEELLTQPYVTSDKIFEEKKDMITKYKVNLETKELYVEYTPRELTTEEKIEKLEVENMILKEENQMLTDYALDLDFRLLMLESTIV